MKEKSTPYSKSPVNTLFRLAVILLAIEVLWLTTLYQHYNPSDYRTKLDEKVAAEDFERKNRIAENTLIFAGLAGVLILLGYGAYKMQKLRQEKLLPGEEDLLYGDKRAPYSGVKTLLFDCGASDSNRMTMNGLLVPVEDKRDTTIEKVTLLNTPVNENADPASEIDAASTVLEVEGFNHFRDNENIALELAQKLKTANPDARVMTVVNKYEKQRVVFEESS